MFGNQSLPSRVYSYGAYAPRTNAELVEEQFARAHRYRNDLVRAELDRRAAVALLLEPHLADLQAEADRLGTEVDAALARVKARNQEARRRVATDADRALLRDLKARRKAAYAALKVRKAELFADPEIKARLAGIDAADLARRKELRAACGLAWGSYLVIEQALQGIRKGAPPKFRRWTGEGKLAVQIQASKPLDTAGLFVQADTRLRVRKGGGRRVVCSFRVGSDGRQPVFADIPFVLHRPLPAGQIKWAYLVRRYVAGRAEYHLQFVIARPGGFDPGDRADAGAVGIDVGWRLVRDGLRVAYWVGTDGREGELVIPHRDLTRWKKAEDLRSIRDGHFNDVRASLASWLKDRAVPDWLRERTKGMGQWRRPARLADVALFWRANRFAGDGEMFAALEAWRKRDKHLWVWMANQQRKALAWRSHLYRNFASRLRREYATAYLEEFDLRRVARAVPPEEEQGPAGEREYRTIAAVSELRRYLGESMRRLVKVEAAYSTHKCWKCGSLEEFDAARELLHRCARCTALWDQDQNAAKILLGRGLAGEG